MARPWRSGGLICNSVACDNGPAQPQPPLQRAKENEFAKARGGTAQSRGEGEADDRDQKDVFDAERPASQPVSGIMIGGADDIRGQCQAAGPARPDKAALDVRQGDIRIELSTPA